MRTPFEIHRATLPELVWLAERMRVQDVAEIGCLFDKFDPAHAARVMHQQTAEDLQFVVRGYAGPVMAFGLARVNASDPNILQAWAYGSDAMRRAVPMATRFMRGTLIPALVAETNVRRVQCFTLPDHDVSHRWLRALGAKHEGRMRAYGRNGEDFDIYGWVRIDVRTI